jgi:methylmalonyl-CoA epimerase
MTRRTSSLTLRHVGIKTEAFDDFCQVMEDAFELDVSFDGDSRAAVSLGADQLLVTRKDAKSKDQGGRALDHLELGAVEPQALMERLEAAGVVVDDVRTSGARTTFLLSPEAWSGVPLHVANADLARAPVATDRNVVGIDHIGVASADNNRALEVFCGLLGLEVESVQTDTEASLRVEQFTSDKYGVRVQHTTGPVTGLRVLFVTLGSFEFEFLQDLNAGSQRAPGVSSSTAGDQGAIANYIERSGPGLHHIALRVKDMRMALQQAEAGGVRLLDREGRPGSRRGQIAFMHPKSTGGVLFHFVQRD